MVEDTLKGQDLYVYNLVKDYGPCSAYDLIRFVDSDETKTVEDRFRFAQGIHGRLSDLEGSFLESKKKVKNPTSGKDVKVYQITRLAGVVGKLEKGGTGYKAQCEALQEELKALKKELESRVEFLLEKIDRKDEEIAGFKAAALFVFGGQK